MLCLLGAYLLPRPKVIQIFGQQDKRVIPCFLEHYPLTATSPNGNRNVNRAPEMGQEVAGEVSLPPSKDVEGFRPVVLSALEMLEPPRLVAALVLEGHTTRVWSWLFIIGQYQWPVSSSQRRYYRITLHFQCTENHWWNALQILQQRECDLFHHLSGP